MQLSAGGFAIWSIVVAAGVMALKFLAWRITGSVALYSDALESIVNVIAAFAALAAIRYAARPADSGHPFGHHKAEYFSAVLEGVLIVVAALLILRESVSALLEPVPIQEISFGLGINLVAAAINGAWAFLLLRAGRYHRSPALTADGHHILSDVVTSIGVAAGLALAVLTDMIWLDPVLAIVVALNIVWQGWKVIAASVDGLMDRAVPPDVAAEINRIILENASGAIEVHDIKTRQAGQAVFIEFHLIVDSGMPVDRAHDICDRIEHELHENIKGSRVTIHVEPEHKVKPEGLAVPE